jgi:DNA-binding NarL/FixJ family response regulator
MPRPVTALILDDEPHILVYLRILLKQLGVDTVWDAADGSAALEQVAAHKPDVVLLDINLPRIGGLEVLKRLKAAHPKMPVIVVSVVSKLETVIRARELGADAYILKHLPRTEVLQMLSSAFDRIAENSGGEAAVGSDKPATPA